MGSTPMDKGIQQPDKGSTFLRLLGPLAWNRMFPFRSGADKQTRKCALPGCEILTSHNGGYCCAEHCRKHRDLQKENS